MHFVVFAIFGFVIPHRGLEFFLMGGAFEHAEEYLASNSQKVYFDCSNPTRADGSNRFWCNGLQDDYWYSNVSDWIRHRRIYITLYSKLIFLIFLYRMTDDRKSFDSAFYIVTDDANCDRGGHVYSSGMNFSIGDAPTPEDQLHTVVGGTRAKWIWRAEYRVYYDTVDRRGRTGIHLVDKRAVADIPQWCDPGFQARAVEYLGSNIRYIALESRTRELLELSVARATRRDNSIPVALTLAALEHGGHVRWEVAF